MVFATRSAGSRPLGSGGVPPNIIRAAFSHFSCAGRLESGIYSMGCQKWEWHRRQDESVPLFNLSLGVCSMLPQVEPFLRKLRRSGGLQRLLIFDIKKKQNINDFKHGFLMEGGRFQAFDSSYSLHPSIRVDEIVSYSNPHSVSKGIRYVFQREEVSASI